MSGKIQDPAVKNFYRQEFKAALWEITSPYKTKADGSFPQRAPYSKRAAASPVSHPSLLPDRDETRMLLAYLLLYPDVAADFLEDLAEWKTAVPQQNDILTGIVESLAADPDITADRLKEHLHSTARTAFMTFYRPNWKC